MEDVLDPEIFTFDGRDFAIWLKGGIPVYCASVPPPRGQRVPDAFPYARSFIGRNEADLPADLKNVYDRLPPITKVAMERGITRLWAETEFRDASQFDIGRTLLILACRLQVKALVDFLPDSLTLLGITYESAQTETIRRQALAIRRQAFQAAIELASGSSQTVRCLELFLEDNLIEDPLLIHGQALEILRYLAIKFPHRFVYWAGIFGQAVVADHRAARGKAKALRAILDEAYGKVEVQRVVDLVRKDHVMRVATDAGALSPTSMKGLYDLATVLHAGREGAAEEQHEEIVTLEWEPRRITRTATVHSITPALRAEMKGS